MQQRIVVKVPMKKEKDRSKAMKVAVGIIGVSSVKIGGEDRDIVIVIGKEVDAVTLTQSLIKKFGGATLVRVEPLVQGYHHFDEDQVQDQVSHNYNTYMTYEGSVPNYYNNNYNYAQPMYQYNSLPPPPHYYYSYDKKPVYDSDCSIM